MKIPYGWVREFVDLRLTAAQAAERLVNAGIEVASVTALAPDLKGVVVGLIEAIERELGRGQGGYPLFLCRVSIGRERYAVVCGAPNTRVGVRAAFAPPGAVRPGGRRIAAAKIYGVESQGMLCSERELGLGEEHEAGILEVADAKPGADLVAALGLDDHVLEVEITPNRPDCLSVLGIARELAALTGARLRPPPVTLRESAEAARGLTRVQIEAPDLCHRFTVRAISAVTVGPSPASLRTAAAYRFERGADIEGLATASARAAALIAELAGGAIARGVVDAYPRRRKPLRVRLRMSRVKRVLGVAPPRAQAVRILSGLGLPVKAHGADLEVTVPSFRRDIAMEDDLVEAIIRAWGYDRPPSPPPAGPIAPVTHPASLRQHQTVRRALVGAGLAEVVTHSFSDPARAALFRRPNDAAPVELLNPLATDASWLRVHPLEGVLGAIATNVRRQQPDVRVFEICKTYARLSGAAVTGKADVSEPASTPRRPPSVQGGLTVPAPTNQGGLTVPATTEPRWVTIALTGTRGEPGWDAGGAQADVYD